MSSLPHLQGAFSAGLDEIFRLVQGAVGAAMVPSSQAILIETFPPEERQMAMAVWGMGVLLRLGP
jgi:MFS family permease